MKLKTKVSFLAASIAGFSAIQAQDRIITPVGVILENERPDGGSPGPWLQYGSPLGAQWYDSSGLSVPLATGDLVPSPLPTHGPYGITVVSRVRDTNETTTSGEASLVFDLGGSFNLEGIILWNSNEGNQTQRGIENMTLSYSTDGGSSFTLGETLSSWTQRATGTIDGEARMLTTTVDDVTHLRIVADNFSGEDIVTFGEIRMIGTPGTALPLLQWASGNASWTGANVWQNEQGSPDTFADGESVEFEDSLSGPSPLTVTLNATVSPEGVAFANSSKDYTITGTGAISGPAGLNKSGTGTVTIATANDYSGNTVHNAGQLNLNNASALGTGSFIIGGGTLDNTSGSAIVNVNDNPMDWDADISFIGSNDLDLGSGAVVLAANTTVEVQAGELTVGGTIGGGGNSGLVKTGSGTLTLTGLNTYPGITTVSEGVLALASGDAISDASRLEITGTGQVALTQSESVNSLFFGISPQAVGTYAAPGVTGVDFNNSLFTGTGILTVLAAEAPETVFWDTSTTAGFQKASGNWNLTESNWSPSGSVLFPWNPASPANFGGEGASAIVTVTENLGAAQLNFLSDGYTLLGDATPRTVTLATGNIATSPGTSTVLGSNLTVTSNNLINIGQVAGVSSGSLSVLAGSQIERRVGNGDLQLDGVGTDVTVSGSVLVSDGLGRLNIGTGSLTGTDVTLTIEGNGIVATETDPAGSGANNVIQVGFAASGISDSANVQGTITVKDNGTFRAGTGGDRSIRLGQFGTGILNIEGNGLVQCFSMALGNGGNGTGILNASGGTIETQSVWPNKPASVANFDGVTIKATGTSEPIIRNGSGTANVLDGGLTVDTNGFDTSITQSLLNGGIAGTGGFTKNGAGVLTVSATSAHPGGTVVNAGTLLVTANWGGATGDVIVNNDATLGGNNLIGGGITVTSAASLAPGPLAGRLLVDGLDISAMAAGTGTLDFELDSLTGNSDLIDALGLNIGSGVLGLGDFSFANLGGLEEGTYSLIVSTGLTGTLDNGDLSGVIVPGFLGELQRNGNNIDLVVTVDPGGVSAFSSWALANGLDGSAGRENGPTADPDNDGVNNIAEFAFNGDPLRSSNNGQVGFLIQDASAPAGNEFTLIVAVRDGASFASSGTSPNVVQTASVDGVTYTIQGSLNLATIPGANVSSVGVPSDTAPAATGLPSLAGTDWEYRTFKIDASESLAAPRGFMRAAVSETP